MRLDDRAVAAGFRLLALGTVGSTNTEARACAQRGERGPLWVCAVEQTGGRGRMARSWASPPGNLYASLLLSDPSPFTRAPELAFVAALAVRDAAVAVAPALADLLSLKWPNDVLLDGKKCAGILIEGERAPADAVSAVIGVGMNCTSHPPEAAYPATHLAAHGADVGPAELLRTLSAAMCARLAQWDRGRGFAATLDDWRAAAHGVGTAVTVRNGTGEKRGRFAGLDATGHLMLELPGGAIEKIAAGDIFPFDPGNGSGAAAGRG